MSSSSSSSSSSASAESDSEKHFAPTQSKRKREPVEDESDSSDDESSSEPEDVPEISALSHAERRRQKKKAKLDEKAAKSASKTRTGKEARTGKDDVPAAQAKRQHSVWVGNMTFKTTVEALKGFFDGVGEITRVHMPMKIPSTPTAKPENRGFAYVDFATPEAKIIAITMSEKPLNGRRLLIKDGDDYTGRPALAGAEGADGADASKNTTGLSKTAQKILRAQKQPPAPTLFLGNLGFETTEQSIRELLEAHRAVKKKGKAEEGEGADKKAKGKEPVAVPEVAAVEGENKPQEKDVWLRKVRMGTFEDSGLCKGFAFVDFTSTEHATAALVNPKNHSLNGRKLVVEYASADAVRRGGGPRPKREDGPPRNPKDKYSKETRRRAADNGGYKGAPRDARARTTEDPSAEEQAPPKRQRVEEPQPWWSGEGGGRGESGSGRGGRDKSNRPRSKPGAALALAKRESAAIVPSQGKKTQF